MLVVVLGSFVWNTKFFLILFAGIEENSTMISYKLGEQLSSGQRVEVNVPLIETSWTNNENSLIDQMQFQSKCSLKNL